MQFWTKSWNPLDGDFVGTTVRHEETITMSDYLTIYDKQDQQRVIYKPTCFFTYRPSQFSIFSLKEFAENNFTIPMERKIINEEIVSGKDTLGVFLCGNSNFCWWIGSILDINESRKNAPGNSATSAQVGISLVASLIWAIENQNEGVHFPDTLPTDFILKICKPFLGDFVSIPKYWKTNIHSWTISDFIQASDLKDY